MDCRIVYIVITVVCLMVNSDNPYLSTIGTEPSSSTIPTTVTAGRLDIDVLHVLLHNLTGRYPLIPLC